MTAPLFFVAAGALAGADVGDQIDLAGSEARHAVKVRRIAAGERVDLADGAGVRVEGVVRRVDGAGAGPGAGDGAGLVVEVLRRVDEPPPALRLVLVQALAKGDRDVAAVETATELGVDEIVPWQAERSVVVWRGDRAAKSQHRWAATVLAAAKQSRRAWIPVVADVLDTNALAARISRTGVAGSGAALVLHEDAAEPLAGSELPTAGDLLVIVGPEGGIAESELARLTAAGAVAVRLGPSVLRSSSAGPAALAVLSARSRWR
jgi:16S rRNA (uracil1498-N3)-methyltransferase